jgi:hypothetical protein
MRQRLSWPESFSAPWGRGAVAKASMRAAMRSRKGAASAFKSRTAAGINSIL